MSLINKEISDFTVQAYHEDAFKEVSKADVLGKWGVFFLLSGGFHFCVPLQSWKTWQRSIRNFRRRDARYTRFPATPITCIRRGTMRRTGSKRSHIPCLQILPMYSPGISKCTSRRTALAERGTFIVNPEGKIVSYEVNAGNVGRNADELLRKLQACQFVHEHGDEVCPAKWQPGAETLKPSLDLVGQL